MLSPLGAQQPLWLPSRARSVHMQAQPATNSMTVTLTGCSNGIGVGLDPQNRVDLLRPGTPAEKQLKIGDIVTHWNGMELFRMENGRKVQVKLIEVAPDPLQDSYTLSIERIGNAFEAQSWDKKSW
jgi:hypothetical protein